MSSTSENISNSILIYSFEFIKNIEFDSELKVEVIHVPDKPVSDS